MGPLSSLKVVELAGLGPCPHAGQLLADLGATVLCIDKHAAVANTADINRRNKQSIALDLKHPDASAVALSLIARADILIEGYRPGVMERLGLGPSECLAMQPALVYGRITGWGQTGPLARRAGHDINYLSLTGALGAMGAADTPPCPPLNLVADYGGGSMNLLFGALAACIHAQQTGQGQVVDAAMIDGVTSMLGLVHSWVAEGQWNGNRSDNLIDGGAPFYRSYATADQRHVAVGALEPKFFSELVKQLNLPLSLVEQQYDRKNWPQMHVIFEATFASKTLQHWSELFADSDACVTPVLDFNEAEEHPHNVSRQTTIRVNGVRQGAPVPRFSETTLATPAPPTGATADKLLLAAGYSADQVAEFRDSGLIGGVSK